MNRYLQKFIIDLILWTLCLPLAYLLRLEGNIGNHLADIALVTTASIPVKAGILYLLRFHLQAWHKIGVWDLFRILQAVAMVAVFAFLSSLLLRSFLFIPLSVPLIEAFIAIIMLSAVRLAARITSEGHRRYHVEQSSRKVERILIAGAGEAGTMLAKEVRRHPESYMEVIGFLDDNASKQKEWYFGHAIFGPLRDLKKVVSEYNVDKVVIAMPTAPGEVVRNVVAMSQDAGVRYQIMPGLYELLSGKFRISQLRDVAVSDLLRRQQVKLDFNPISQYLNDRVVLVSGAGGSIGSEIVRQITGFNPKGILLLGRGENSIYVVEREMKSLYPHLNVTSLIADVRDRETLESIYRQYRPEVVFHAAAHKHVPLMECNPEQAIFNNVGGTQNMAELALITMWNTL